MLVKDCSRTRVDRKPRSFKVCPKHVLVGTAPTSLQPPLCHFSANLFEQLGRGRKSTMVSFDASKQALRIGKE